MVEECLVVPRRYLFGAYDERAFTGFRSPRQWQFDLESILQKHAEFKPRRTSEGEYDVENDISYKQIIPGAVFLYDDKIFTYTRLEGSGERRMFGRNDILIGGHVNPQDKKETYNETFWNALHREIAEEVDYDDSYSLDQVGYVNTEGTPLDSVHFGLVYVIRGRSPNIAVRETEAMRGSLMTVEEIDQLEPPLQSWHKHIFEAYKKGELK